MSTISNGYEFKGYEMGMSLSDFKSRGLHEDVYLLNKDDRYFNWVSKLVCSDENKSEYSIRLDRYPDNTVVICSIKEVASKSGISHFKDGYMWLKISNGTYPIQPTFTFVSLKNGDEPVLSMIDFELFSTNFLSLLSTLKEKYKSPVTSTSQNLQNNFGSTFRNEKYIWRDKTSEIELQKYSGGYTSEKSSVYFFLKSGEKEMSRLIKEKSKDKKSGF
jgi:hypothetical protein